MSDELARAARHKAHNQARETFAAGLKCWACDAYVQPPNLFCEEHKHLETEILKQREEHEIWLRKQLTK